MTLAARNQDGAAGRMHVPVMVDEVCDLLCAHGPRAFVDATLGAGGHSAAMIARCATRVLGIDRDAHAREAAAARLADAGDRVVIRAGDFADIRAIAGEAGFVPADAILADLGMSSLALDDPERGFSFRTEGPLDMRMDQSGETRAYDLINEESETELARIIFTYGEERASRRIARFIVEARRRRPISTTSELRAVVERALGVRRRGGIHPATRTFQAIRIAVNREMESLAALLRDAPAMLSEHGRLAILSYHSLEDRAVKERFRALAGATGFTVVTRKAARASEAEVSVNPRARSAKLRCIEREAR